MASSDSICIMTGHGETKELIRSQRIIEDKVYERKKDRNLKEIEREKEELSIAVVEGSGRYKRKWNKKETRCLWQLNIYYDGHLWDYSRQSNSSETKHKKKKNKKKKSRAKPSLKEKEIRKKDIERKATDFVCLFVFYSFYFILFYIFLFFNPFSFLFVVDVVAF